MRKAYVRNILDTPTPIMTDDALQDLGTFYRTHSDLHAVPFIRFVVAPANYCRFFGVREVPPLEMFPIRMST